MADKQTVGLTRSDLRDLYHWLDNDWLFLDPSLGLDDCEIADVDDLRAKLAIMPTETAGPLLHDAIRLIERQRAEYADWSKRYALPEPPRGLSVVMQSVEISELARAEAGRDG